MKIMQRPLSKFLVASAVLCLPSFCPAYAQTSGFRLKTADSLFVQKRYTQALEHYQEILRQDQYTPAMLLKMAYVNEGLNHIGAAMYYLNLYYLATADKSTLSKMAELADKFHLEGYETTDSDRIRAFYLDYHLYISVALAAFMVLLFSVVYHTRIRGHKRPAGSFGALAVLAALLFVHQQYGTHEAKGILANTSNYIMDGPSAGASVIDIVGDGHRVDILGQKDVWMKIRWDNQTAYVKENSVRPVKL